MATSPADTEELFAVLLLNLGVIYECLGTVWATLAWVRSALKDLTMHKIPQNKAGPRTVSSYQPELRITPAEMSEDQHRVATGC